MAAGVPCDSLLDRPSYQGPRSRPSEQSLPRPRNAADHACDGVGRHWPSVARRGIGECGDGSADHGSVEVRPFN